MYVDLPPAAAAITRSGEPVNIRYSQFLKEVADNKLEKVSRGGRWSQDLTGESEVTLTDG